MAELEPFFGEYGSIYFPGLALPLFHLRNKVENTLFIRPEDAKIAAGADPLPCRLLGVGEAPGQRM